MRRSFVGLLCLLAAAAGLTATASSAPAVPTSPALSQAAGTFHPVDATRVLDTRTGSGLASARTDRFAVAGHGAIAAGSAAVVVNVTVLTPARSGSLSVFPGTSGWNGAASISFLAGQTKQSMITAVLGSDGSLSVRNNTAATVQVIADVVGYYTGGTASTPGSFQAVGFSRVFDTRAAGSHALPAASATRVPLAGRAGLPATGMAEVVANLTVINPARGGSVSTYASGSAWDGSASESFAAGRTEQDVLTIGVGADGAAMIRNNTASPLTVVLDVLGYFRSGTPTGYGSYQPGTPYRIVDQRVGPQPSRAGQVIISQPAGTGSPLPDWGTPAMVVRLTVITPARAGSISVYRIDRSWNGSATMSFPAGPSAQQQLLIPLGADSRFQIRNNLAVPIIMVVNVLGYYTGVANPLDVTSSAVADPQRGSLTDVSCPTAAFCMATQAFGYAATWNGAAWSQPAKISPAGYLGQISCASATRCFASGSTDRDRIHPALFGYDGTQWTLAFSSTVRPVVSCPSQNFCLATVANTYRTFDGTSWSAAASGSGGVSLSCVSSSFCMSMDPQGRFSTYDGTGWLTPAAVANLPAKAVSCTAPTFCLAVGARVAGVFDGTGWTLSQLPANISASRVSCISSSSCFALGTTTVVSHFDGTGWSTPQTVDPESNNAGTVSCSQAGTCAVIDTTVGAVFATAVTFDGAHWSSVVPVDQVPGQLDDISCTSDSFCMAVDDHGYAIRYDGTSWATPVPVIGDAFTGIACGSPTLCVALDGVGNAYAYNGSSWVGKQIQFAAKLSVSCPGPSFCMVASSLGTATTFDGSTWTSASTGVNGLTKVSCASTSFCLAVTDQGGTATYNGTNWSAGSSGGVVLPSSLSCPSATYCLETDSGSASQWRNGTWSLIEAGNGKTLDAVSCSSAQRCVSPLSTLVDGPNTFVAWDGSEWTLTTVHSVPSPLWSESRISCPTDSFCMSTNGADLGYRLVG